MIHHGYKTIQLPFAVSAVRFDSQQPKSRSYPDSHRLLSQLPIFFVVPSLESPT